MKTLLGPVWGFVFAFRTLAGEPDAITTAPHGQYSIIEHGVSTDDCGWCFDTTLRFQDKSKPDVNLTLHGGEFEDAAWRSGARYFISPDGRWFLRIQHLGGGTNCAFLYSVLSNGRVHRTDISRLVFDRIEHVLHSPVNGRTQIEFGSWDTPSNSIVLDASYEPLKNDVQQPWLNFKATYHFKSGRLLLTKSVDEN